MVVRQKLILMTKYVYSSYEKFVNNPESRDMNNTTEEKNKTIYKIILIKLFFFPASVLLAFNNYYPLIFLNCELMIIMVKTLNKQTERLVLGGK